MDLDQRKFAAFMVDLDGTLLGRDEKIAPRVAKAVDLLSKKMPVCIVTGREPKDVISFARELGLTAPQVCDNGALILDPTTGDEVWSAPLGKRYVRDVVEALVSRDAHVIATHAGGTVTRANEISSWNVTRVSAMDVVESVADELLAQFEPHPEIHVVKAFLPYNGLWAVNFTANGVTKGEAIKCLGRILGLATGDMIGAGDSYNDVPMLEVCGLGIAMGEAPDELKALADYVAPSVDEDGLAVAIEDFALPLIS